MQLQQLLEAMIAYMGGDARRIQHFIKVHTLAQLIGRQEQLNERTQFILEAAALTHDIDPSSVTKKQSALQQLAYCRR